MLDYLLAGNVDWAVYLFQYKAVLILCGLVIGYAHIQFGKHSGRYYCEDLSAPPRWKVYLTLYAGVSTSLLLGAIAAALLSRQSLS